MAFQNIDELPLGKLLQPSQGRVKKVRQAGYPRRKPAKVNRQNKPSGYRPGY